MSAKNLHPFNRWRNRVVGFRVSEAESQQINAAVMLSGLSKQEYIVSRLLNQDIIIQANPSVRKAFRNQLAAVLTELRRIEAGAEIQDELPETIQMLSRIMANMEAEPA